MSLACLLMLEVVTSYKFIMMSTLELMFFFLLTSKYGFQLKIMLKTFLPDLFPNTEQDCCIACSTAVRNSYIEITCFIF